MYIYTILKTNDDPCVLDLFMKCHQMKLLFCMSRRWDSNQNTAYFSYLPYLFITKCCSALTYCKLKSVGAKKSVFIFPLFVWFLSEVIVLGLYSLRCFSLNKTKDGDDCLFSVTQIYLSSLQLSTMKDGGGNHQGIVLRFTLSCAVMCLALSTKRDRGGIRSVLNCVQLRMVVGMTILFLVLSEELCGVLNWFNWALRRVITMLRVFRRQLSWFQDSISLKLLWSK